MDLTSLPFGARAELAVLKTAGGMEVEAVSFPKIESRDIPRLVSELREMRLPALVARYRELYGEPPRSRNRGWLVRRLAWRTQELAEGGLPPSVLRSVAELGDQLPERWRMRMAQRQRALVSVDVDVLPRDPRLPAPGTVLRRVYRGKAHAVTVLEHEFEYSGKKYSSLSAVAKAISGASYNGFQFFKLPGKP